MRGFKPVYYIIGVHLIMAWGWYRYGKGIREQQYVLPSDEPAPPDFTWPTDRSAAIGPPHTSQNHRNSIIQLTSEFLPL